MRVLRDSNALGSKAPPPKPKRHLILRALAAFIIFVVAITLLFVLTAPVAHATDLPDSVTFNSAHVNRYLYEEGDMLITLHYTISYETLPDDPVDETFIFRVMDEDGVTQLAATTAYPFADDGYGQGLVSWYFAADDAPTWEGAYILRICGNPSAFEDPPEYNYTLESSDYTSETTQAGNQDDLATRVLDVAMDLEIAWDASLLDLSDVGVVLGTTGESYFRYAIPGLQVMAPSVFYTYVAQTDYTERDWGTNESTNWTSRFDDTWVGESLSDAADLFQVDYTLIGGIFVLAACIALTVLSARNFATTHPGFIASVALTICGALMGWMSWAMLGVMALFFALYIGYFLFFQRA